MAYSHWMSTAGEAYVIAAAILQGVAAILSRRTLDGCRLGTFVFVRNFFSAVVFFAIGTAYYGVEHFAHAFGPRLWVVMTFYGAVVVAIGQSAWYRSLARLPASTVASFSMTAPLLGILFAWLLLGEVPSAIQWGGAAVIFAGMVVTRLGPSTSRVPDDANLGMEKSLAGA